MYVPGRWRNQKMQKIATDKTGMGPRLWCPHRSDVSSIKSGPTAWFIKLKKLHFMLFLLICGRGGYG
jgi:hypothetical protein